MLDEMHLLRVIQNAAADQTFTKQRERAANVGPPCLQVEVTVLALGRIALVEPDGRPEPVKLLGTVFEPRVQPGDRLIAGRCSGFKLRLRTRDVGRDQDPEAAQRVFRGSPRVGQYVSRLRT